MKKPLEPEAPGITLLVGMLLGSGVTPTELPADGVGVAGGILMEMVGKRPKELVGSEGFPLPEVADPGVLDPVCGVDVSEALAVPVGRSPDSSPLPNSPEDVIADGDAIGEDTAEDVGTTSLDVGWPVDESERLDKSPVSNSPEDVVAEDEMADETGGWVGMIPVDVG